MKLAVNGEDFMINGMNWDFFPIGSNYSYSLWNQPEDLIKSALEYTKGHRNEAANLLGYGRNTLTRKIKELAIE